MNAMARAVDILGIDQIRRLADAGLVVVDREEMELLRDVALAARVAINGYNVIEKTDSLCEALAAWEVMNFGVQMDQHDRGRTR